MEGEHEASKSASTETAAQWNIESSGANPAPAVSHHRPPVALKQKTVLNYISYKSVCTNSTFICIKLLYMPTCLTYICLQCRNVERVYFMYITP